MSRKRRPLPVHFTQWRGRGLRTVTSIMSTRPHSASTTSAALWLPAECVMGRAASEVVQGEGRRPLQRVWGSVVGVLFWALLCGLLYVFMALGASLAHAQVASVSGGSAGEVQLQAMVEELTQAQKAQAAQSPAASVAKQPRIEVVLGELDPRLKLAPCQKVHAYMPDGVRFWGKSRVGLRCVQGPVRWNVYWPVTVKVWATGLVAATTLYPGNTVAAADLREGEVDLAATASPALVQATEVVGRTVARHVEAGESLRDEDLKVRRWFSAGDSVRLTVRGPGFQVGGLGTALTHGDEGHCARIRTDSGRVVCGEPVGERQAELSL